MIEESQNIVMLQIPTLSRLLPTLISSKTSNPPLTDSHFKTDSNVLSEKDNVGLRRLLTIGPANVSKDILQTLLIEADALVQCWEEKM